MLETSLQTAWIAWIIIGLLLVVTIILGVLILDMVVVVLREYTDIDDDRYIDTDDSDQ